MQKEACHDTEQKICVQTRLWPNGRGRQGAVVQWCGEGEEREKEGSTDMDSVFFASFYIGPRDASASLFILPHLPRHLHPLPSLRLDTSQIPSQPEGDNILTKAKPRPPFVSRNNQAQEQTDVRRSARRNSYLSNGSRSLSVLDCIVYPIVLWPK